MVACQGVADHEIPIETSISKHEFLEYIALHGKEVVITDSILVIPGVGCGGCITNAQMYFEQQAGNTRILYVFTGIDDLKIFEQEIAKDYWMQENVFVDSLNYLMKNGFDSSYPSWLIDRGEEYDLQTFE